MVLNITVDTKNADVELYGSKRIALEELMTETAQREYRRAARSRRQTFMWRWNLDCYNRSSETYRGSLVGLRDKYGSCPVLAEVYAYVHY